MSRITISFDIDNAPFEDDPEEVQKVLKRIGNRINLKETDQLTILDSYGHSIGICVVTID